VPERPTIYASNWASWRSAGHHGPGRKLSVMARPTRPWELGDACIPDLMPKVQDLAKFKAGRITEREYLLRMVGPLGRRAHQGDLGPGRLTLADSTWWYRGGANKVPAFGSPVAQDGDTLCCVCARPGPDREHRCHLELVSEYLVRGGWDVVLYGRRMTWREPAYRCSACGNDDGIQVRAGRAECPDCHTNWWVHRKGIYWLDGARFRGALVA